MKHWHVFSSTPEQGESTLQVLESGTSMFVANVSPQYADLIAKAPVLLEALETVVSIARQSVMYFNSSSAHIAMNEINKADDLVWQLRNS